MAAQRSQVPKFGNWESEDNVPYTVFFDKARKGRGGGGGMINPNDPQDNPDAFRGNGPPSPAPASALPPHARAPASRSRGEQEGLGRGVVRPDHERRASREEFADSPGRNENLSRRAGNGPGEPQRRPMRPSVGSEYSVDRSPLHPQQGRGGAAGRGMDSPSRDRRNPNEAIQGTPGRSRMKPQGRGNNADKGPTVPRFGDWDETNPSSAAGYTQVFNKVREEKQTGSVRVPGMGADPSSHSTGARPVDDYKPKRACCPWF